jgi:hypothetical protein
MKGKGILLHDDYELQVKPVRNAAGMIISGLRIGNTLYQNQCLILKLYPGSLVLNPVVGVGIDDMLLGNDFLEWRRKIRQQLELDGQEVAKVAISVTGKPMIDAQYSKG